MNLRTRFVITSSVVLASLFVTCPVVAGTLVVANKAEATVSLIDQESGKVVATLATGQGPHEVGISPDGRFALVTNYGTRDGAGGSLTLIDVPAAEAVKTFDIGDQSKPHGVEWIDKMRHDSHGYILRTPSLTK